MLWSDKYAPQRLDEVIGHSQVVARVREWADAWNKGKPQRPLLFFGDSGNGKTTIAELIARENDWELLEINASDTRNKDAIERTIGQAAKSATFSGKRRLILIDEVDGLYAQDRGGVSAITNILKDSNNPIVLTADDAWDIKIRSIKQACEDLRLGKVDYRSVAKLLSEIAGAENVECDKELCTEIAKRSSGGIRAAINDLQVLAQGKARVVKEDLGILGERDSEEGMFDIMGTVLRSRDFKKSRSAVMDSSESPDFILKWVEENVPRSHQDAQDLNDGFYYVSRADIFLARAQIRQQYSMWRYATDLMSSGVSVSKQHHADHFSPYQFPAVIRYLSSSKGERSLRKSIGLKVGERCHVSSREAIQSYVPMLVEEFKHDGKAAAIQAQFEFSEEELEFLGAKSVKKLMASAEALRNEEIKKTIHERPVAKTKGQTGLNSFS